MAPHEDHAAYLQFSNMPHDALIDMNWTAAANYAPPSLPGFQSRVAGCPTSYVRSYSSSGSVTFDGNVEYGFIPDEPSETTHLLSNGSSRPPYHARSPSLSSVASTTFSPEQAASTAQCAEPTPLPMKQLMLLMIGQLPEPVVATVIYPFVNALVAELAPTGGDLRRVGYYAGFIESVFFFFEFCFVLRWGRLSDRIGRKPVILCGLIGLTLSSASFGLARTYWGLILSRALAGVLSGNIGVMKSAIGEITDASNIAEGFAFLPVVWSAGTTIGPLIGGYLSRPQEKFPRLFASGFWKTYPYFLPCGCAAMICLTSAITIALFLEESLPALRRQKIYHDEEYQHLEASGPKRITHQRTSSEETLVDLPRAQSSVADVLTSPVIVAISNYGAVALLDIAFMALLPLFLSTPVQAGGLGYSPSQIGLMMGVLGLLNGVMQGLFSAKVQRYFGVKTVYVVGVMSYVGIYAAFPMLNSLARRGRSQTLIFGLMTVQLALNIFGNMSFGCIFLYITAASDKDCLGTTNGVAQTVASFMRMMGPATASSLFAITIEGNLMGGKFVYWVFVGFTCIALFLSTLLPKRVLSTI